MSDQPKPTTDEWTAHARIDGLVDLMDNEGLVARGITKAKAFTIRTKHNAALAAEREISATLAEQLHELRVTFGQAEDWNKITSIEINNIRSLNKEIEEDKLKTELACEQWIRQCEELQQQLATEREKWKSAEDLTRDNGRLSGELAKVLRENERLEQLLAAEKEYCVENRRLRKIISSNETSLGVCVREQKQEIQQLRSAHTDYDLLRDDYRAIADSNQQLREQLDEAIRLLSAEREKCAKSDEFRERLRGKYHRQSDVLAEAKSLIQQLRSQLDTNQGHAKRAACVRRRF